MCKIKKLLSKLAGPCVAMFSAVLFIAANSNSCAMVYQPKAPANLSKFSKTQ